MSRLFRILRAVHCRSTHHYFALDALTHVDTVPGQRLSQMLLQYYSAYLSGAKAPDTKFRDFQNHVVHVADGNWGGAPQACEKWLKQAIEHLDRQQWKQAAYACGVLSHYFTDPLMPLHTGQTERESVVHRPLEWSVFKSYDAIFETLRARQLQAKIQFSHGSDWISKAVIAGANVAHQHYGRLLEIYNLEQGTRTPVAGLDAEARGILAELFSVAHTGWAQVLCRIADTTTAEIPDSSLTLAGLLASIDVPLAWLLKRFSDATERKAVAAIYNEFVTTGTVRKYLPSDVSMIQEQRAEAGLFVAASTSPVAAIGLDWSEHSIPQGDSIGKIAALGEANAVASDLSADSDFHAADTEGKVSRRLDSIPFSITAALNKSSPTLDAPVIPRDAPAIAEQLAPQQPHVRRLLTRTEKFLDGDSPLVDAPSIGPKTAKRFEKIGVFTIGDFLSADPAYLAIQLATRWVTVQLLSDWQGQARLVCEVPSLRGFEAQLLVAANCRSGADLATRDPRGLFARISAIVPTSDGERILRNNSAPLLDDAIGWIDAAQHARPLSHRRRSA